MKNIVAIVSLIVLSGCIPQQQAYIHERDPMKDPVGWSNDMAHLSCGKRGIPAGTPEYKKCYEKTLLEAITILNAEAEAQRPAMTCDTIRIDDFSRTNCY